MSAASQQIRVALEGQKDGLLRSEIFGKCTAPKATLNSALKTMCVTGEASPIAGETPRKTRYKLSGKAAPETPTAQASASKRGKKKKRKASKPAKRKSATAFKRAPAKPNGAHYLPAITADSRLVLIDPDGPARIFGVKDTEEIAELVLVHFEAD